MTTYQYQIPALYLMNTIPMEPIRKIRIQCEALLGTLPQAKREELLDLYKVAVALDAANRDRDHICVAWPFENTEANFARYIAPWLKIFPDFQYRNELEKGHKLSKLKYVVVEIDEGGSKVQYRRLDAGWENFFTITTKLGLSAIALDELKAQFSVYAMGRVMSELTDVLKNTPVLVPSSALKAHGKKPTDKFGGVKGSLDAK